MYAFHHSTFSRHTIQEMNNQGADQTACMRSLVRVLLFAYVIKQIFS